MNADKTFPMEGGCTCRAVRYRMESKPLFVHCCHCTWCQRETGSAFALNAIIESDRLTVLEGTPEDCPVPSPSGKGQTIVRCPECRVAVWSYYAGAGRAAPFVRVGTLDDAREVRPDVHIFTSTRQSWVALPDDVPVCKSYYSRKELWPAESLVRAAAMQHG